MGEIEDALESGRMAVEIVGAHASPESFKYAVALHNRGAALLAARRPAEALPDLTRAAGMLRGLLPPSHGLTGTYQADLALALARDGRHAEAQRAIADVLPQGRRPHDLSATWPSYVLGVAKRLAGDPARRPPRATAVAGVHGRWSGQRAGSHANVDGDRCEPAGAREARSGCPLPGGSSHAFAAAARPA